MKAAAFERILQEASLAIEDSRVLIDVTLSKVAATRQQLAASIQSIRASRTALLLISRNQAARTRRDLDDPGRSRPAHRRG